jgi:hypothetical protein
MNNTDILPLGNFDGCKPLPMLENAWGCGRNLDLGVVHVFDDRIRAVEYTSNLANRLDQPSAGFISKECFEGLWYRNYQRQLDLPAGYALRNRSSHWRRVAVEHYLATIRYCANRAAGLSCRAT